jgi:hypothetical protein
MTDKTEGWLAEYDSKRGLFHVVHEGGENYVAPECIAEIGEAMIDVEGDDPRLMCYVMIDGAEEQLDVPGIELEALADAWGDARKKGKV